jgi:Fe-S cluster assembly protein SufD
MSVQALIKDIPTTKQEKWKFSNLPGALKNLELVPADAVWDMTGAFDYIEPDAKWPGQAESEPSLSGLNAAFPSEVLALRIPKGKQVIQPIHLTLEGHEGQLLTSRLVIDVEEGADVVVIEHHKGLETYWKNCATEISVEANARLLHYRIIEDDPFAVNTQVANVSVRRDGVYECFTLTTGAKWSRSETHAHLLAENSTASLSGVTLLDGKRFADTTVLIEHEAPHCPSNQYFKTLLDDQSHGVFQGKIHVHQVAQKTDGYQLSNNILLSPLAEMNVKPELEIYADDVKCSHGTTTGALDETPMFYLRSRGLSEKDARRLLIEAFLGEATEKITHDDTRTDIEARIRLWLG